MIDTIRLAITYDTPPVWLTQLFPNRDFDLASGTIKGILNPSSAAKRRGVYLPRLTYRARPSSDGRMHDLLIEVSLPKLLFGNNFSELSEQEFGRVCGRLTSRLNQVGIPITYKQLRTAEVRKIDFCKNVVFNDYTSVSSIVADLRTADISKRNDTQHTNFRNGGSTYHVMHTNALDVSVYDKISDLQQGRLSDKRAFENDNYTQLDLLETLTENKSLSVVRFEVRLSSKAKIRLELQGAGIDLEEITFEHMYQVHIARTILGHYWKEILNRVPKAPLDSDTPEKLLSEVLKSDNISPQSAFAQVGYLLCVSDNDARHIRNLIDQRFGKHVWSRLKQLRAPPAKSRLTALLTISQAIESMEPIDITKLGLSNC